MENITFLQITLWADNSWEILDMIVQLENMGHVIYHILTAAKSPVMRYEG